MINIEELKEKAIDSINNAKSLKDLEDIRVNYFGKKGEITSLMQHFKDMATEDRKKFGQIINDAKKSIDDLIKERCDSFNSLVLNEKLKKESIDVSLPAKKIGLGHLHPCTIVFNDVKNIFEKMGYSVVTGPEIEFDEYNFEKLNIEKGHPARDEQDTFYINEKVLLRTQTSPVQARVMEKGKLPICIISAGRVFRSDSVDATHSPTFHQIEGLVVDENISFTDLKGTLTTFAKSFFGEGIKTRFRPHHFPFTEPSAEMDVSCFKCGGKGCRFCKNEGWIEILGCGMVNPRVYELCGLDKDKCQGFAFGMGIERLALLKYEIDDMRLLYENDVRFLNQFD
ncbi:MAG: phenylalanine--tRNA ligase subunit alpha [Lachnospiraceae bacterium]|nr:phenylalanine--tRNA ligase subunit alpha [Lachnospiraceae bacterium]